MRVQATLFLAALAEAVTLREQTLAQAEVECCGNCGGSGDCGGHGGDRGGYGDDGMDCPIDKCLSL